MATPSSRGAAPSRSGRASWATSRPRAAVSKTAETPRSAPSSGSTLSPWRSVLGPESRLPNVYWQAMSPSTLRRMTYFTALPPPEHVEVGGEVSYRYVRQDSELWGALHGGRLTTARLKDALGLRDATAARLGVGGPQFAEAGVSRAYKHLTTTTAPAAAAVQPPGTTSDAGQRRGGGGHEEAMSRNELARLSYNLQLGDGPEAGGMEEEAGWSQQDRRRISELAALAAGAAGAARMRLLWGTLQESAAVATLSLMFPGSQLEEVGLVALEDPTPWGVGRGEIPPMGASPDALITHRVPITHADLQGAAQQLRTTTSPPALRAAASAVLRTALERHTQQQLQHSGLLRTASDSGSSSSSSSSSTSGALTPAGAAAGGAELTGAGLPLHASGESQALGWIEGKLRDAVLAGSGSGGGAAAAAAAASGGVLRREAGASGGGHGAGGGDGVAGVVLVREAVEVKNSCPFVYKGQRKARKRGINIHYVVSDRGPHGGLWPLWVPQLQAHMAAAGTGSALLLSRSASRGVRLFRVYRDDAYLVSALDLVRELQHAHVARGTPPGADPWATRPGYGDFVRHTVEVARGATVVLETGATPQVPGCLPGGAFWAMR